MKKVDEQVHYFDPVVIEKRLWNMNYLFFAMIIGLIIVVSIVSILFLFDLPFMSAIAMVSIFIAFYSIFLFFLIEPRLLREVQKSSVTRETYERPVVQEVIKEIEKPVVREVIKEIEKPVIKEVIREMNRPVYRDVQKTVYVEKPRKKLNIPKYAYFGSTETKVYHARKCRFRKLIKRKYQVTSNTPTYFKNRNFTPCKICLVDGKTRPELIERKSRRVSRKANLSKSKLAKPVKPVSFSSRAAELREKETIESQIAKNTGKLNQMISKIDKVSRDTNKKTVQVSKQVKDISSKVDKTSKASSKKTTKQLSEMSSRLNRVSRDVKKASKKKV